ncbi:1,3-beta-glucan synthase subunit FKS1-like, domain-1 [Artemisia annua]|uniref:1,3-beta-glucan synthase subunit FKS1-like, domain-1 n=1 Tax=Artemisia annua TaxID=35608 RepID=A0A2U1MPG8_ARTAN|nr:1,3-beta-glucan synthase subunit FKS1-like, domain-1 [Artemisia annua]
MVVLLILAGGGGPIMSDLWALKGLTEEVNLRRWIESSDWLIIRFFLWWSQPRIYVGRGMHESQFALIK